MWIHTWLYTLHYWGLHSSGMLRSADWQLVTDVSGQPVAPIVKCHAVNSLTFHVNRTWQFSKDAKRGRIFYTCTIRQILLLMRGGQKKTTSNFPKSHGYIKRYSERHISVILFPVLVADMFCDTRWLCPHYSARIGQQFVNTSQRPGARTRLHIQRHCGMSLILSPWTTSHVLFRVRRFIPRCPVIMNYKLLVKFIRYITHISEVEDIVLGDIAIWSLASRNRWTFWIAEVRNRLHTIYIPNIHLGVTDTVHRNIHNCNHLTCKWFHLCGNKFRL